MDPLIVSLRIAPQALAHFDALRRRYFPPERNVIAAHVTLFHKLPGEEEDEIRAVLQDEAERTLEFPVTVRPPRRLGFGVAYDLESAALMRLRATLSARFARHLGPQDRQGFRPHITVQNKVSVKVAQDTLAELAAAFVPLTFAAEGLDLWRYRGGPWEPAATHGFRRDPASSALLPR
ncbi:hypothetical protein BJF92_01375 [Rhizobium rhizosphaerae]|uniref:2'-5' RNA ligase family protein n=1 Tax=Xaviernesmea rhizosphaerae TaxID=1672749 RepID=A0A1Q9AET0_9HYPH|nr:2'-5' RNA ligase family protein [Xaviernesmea rhizosphaerae]OLP53429.1 hypothetical protein BJF92_01375 [Xaviernesmea rhizosphaerae]